MKKLICTAAACALMLTGAVGCGKDDKSSKGASGSGFEGKWACSEMVVNGTSIKAIPLVDVPLSAAIHIEIKDDGTYVISSGIVGGDDDDEDDSDNTEGKWEKVDDDTIKFTKPEGATDSTGSGGDIADTEQFENSEFDLKDGKLVASVEEDGQTGEVVFERVSEFATCDLSTMDFSISASMEGDIDFEIGGSDSEDDAASTEE